jgi:flavorubredoxin
MHNVSKSHPSYIIADIFKYKGLIVGSPTYSNQLFPEIESLLSKIEVRDMKGRYLGYFGSFCWAGAAVKRLAEFAEKSKFELVGDPVEMKQSMKEITYTQCENLAKAMADRLKVDRTSTH